MHRPITVFDARRKFLDRDRGEKPNLIDVRK